MELCRPQRHPPRVPLNASRAPTRDGHLKNQLNSNLMANFEQQEAAFQIDGNLGITAAIAEMILQSTAGELALLPALPEAWAEGSFSGLRARGGVTVSLTWKRGDRTIASLITMKDTVTRVRPPVGQQLHEVLEDQSQLRLVSDDDGVVTLSLHPGITYKLTFR